MGEKKPTKRGWLRRRFQTRGGAVMDAVQELLDKGLVSKDAVDKVLEEMKPRPKRQGMTTQ